MAEKTKAVENEEKVVATENENVIIVSKFEDLVTTKQPTAEEAEKTEE